MYHVPVLLKQAIKYLDLKQGKFIIDGTIGEGGHAISILEKILPSGKFLGVDWDKSILEKAKQEIKVRFHSTPSLLKSRVFLVNDNYANLPRILKEKKLGRADGLLLDLGFSGFHLKSGKGFSFAFEQEPLIMTYGEKEMSARDFLNKVSEKRLGEIIRTYGEERYYQRIARAIKQSEKPVETNKDLKEIIEKVVKRHGKLHPATKTFMALRIYLNKELDNLKEVLNRIHLILVPQGRLVVISFHSLEDRIVKRKFRELEKRGLGKILCKKPIVPSSEEIKINPRSRSGKLRALQLL